MKERIVIKEDFWVKHFQKREEEFYEEDMCSGGNPQEWWHYEKEQVPETWEELKELVKNFSGKINKNISGYSVGKTAITIVFDGFNLHFDKDGIFNDFIRLNRTPAQMYQIIKSLIGEE